MGSIMASNHKHIRGGDMKNKLDHILATLGEECGEVQQAVGKSLRFGIHDRRPSAPENTNFEQLRHEFHDIVAVYRMLCKQVGANPELSEELIARKIIRVNQYMNYAREKRELS